MVLRHDDRQIRVTDRQSVGQRESERVERTERVGSHTHIQYYKYAYAQPHTTASGSGLVS